MTLEFKWSRLEELSAQAFFSIVKARESVFVVEQQCAYQEVDDMDLQAWHLEALIDNQLAAYARVVDPGIKYEQPSIGRVMTVQAYRHLSIGRSLMNEAIRFTEAQYPHKGIQIGAQLYLKKFYTSLGFETVSDEYDEDGIPHIDMVKPPLPI